MSVAKPLPHDSAALHVSGQARYVDDIPTPANTLHLAFGLSPIAHGKLTSLDLKGVRNADGVLSVLTAADVIGKNDVSPAPYPEAFLAEGTVHYIGQPIFLVLADTHLNARKAARLAKMEFDELTPVITMDDAIEAMNELEEPIVFSKGDTTAALGQAPRRLTGSIDIGGQEHFYLEGQAALAFPQDNGDVVVHSSTQHPTEIQHKVADALNEPYHAVRVETRRMGGGFGGKESQGNSLAVACALGAKLTGRPCKMRYDRDDDMTITGKRHDFRINYDVGFDDDGLIEAIEFTHFCRCGWSADLSMPVADRAMLHSDNAYHLPNAKITSHRLLTNTQSATAYRGFGGPQGMVGIERVLDHIAHDLGADPLAVRQANYYNEMSDASGVGILDQKKQVTPFHMPVTDFVLGDLTQDLVNSSDYQKRRAEIAEWNAEQSVLKRGIALTPVKFGISFTLSHLNQAGALVHVYSDGSIAMNHGGTEMGQGLFQKVAQVAASSFGVDIGAVRITATDTGKVPNTSATAASSGSDLNGMAVKDACDKIKARLVRFLKEQHSDADVVFKNGTVRIGNEVMPFKKAVALAYTHRISLSATGFYATPDIQWDRKKGRGRPFFYFAYGAAVTEVVIDTLTGENRILRTDLLHDCGNSLNPAIDIGQIEGGYVQGAGWLTTEELVWDGKGRLRTHAPSTYKIPACSDRPDIFNVALFDRANPADTIYRSKAVGEPPFMLGISALMALSDAVAACGDGSVYADLSAPATPETVLKAVMRQQGQDW